MYFLGFLGMLCCILDYLDVYVGWNVFFSFGFYIFVVGICCFFVVVIIILSSGNNKRCVLSFWVFELNLIILEWMV